jgi:hypothetical protein
MAPDGSRRIVWMINGMIKAHPMNNRMARQAAHRYAAPLPLLQLAGVGRPEELGWWQSAVGDHQQPAAGRRQREAVLVVAVDGGKAGRKQPVSNREGRR